MPIAVAGVFCQRTDGNGPRVEELQVFLLGKLLREISRARRGEEICDEQLTLARALEAQVESIDVFHGLQAVGEKKMPGEIRVVFRDSASRGVAADIAQAGIIVNGGEIGAGDRAVLVKQKARAEGS